MARDIETLKSVLEDAAKKREALQDEKAEKLRWLSNRYDTKIKKYDIYIEMLRSEIGKVDVEKPIVRVEKDDIQPRLIPRVRPIDETASALDIVPSDVPKNVSSQGNTSYSEIMRTVLEEHRKPMKVKQIIEAMASRGQEIRAKQPYSAAMRILKRNNTVFYRRGKNWGLMAWRIKQQENARKEDESAAG